MDSIADQLDVFVRTLKTITAKNRLLVIEEEVKPALRIIAATAHHEDAPESLAKSCAAMNALAALVASDHFTWHIHLDRLLSKARSLKLLARVQPMGKSGALSHF